MHIILCGYKACGKSTLAQAYSQQYSCAYIDTDDLLLAEFGQSKPNVETISELFHRLGESRFRSCEAQTLAKLNPVLPSIIATGGGAINNPDNVAHLKSLGQIIYLAADKKTLCERIMAAATLPSFIDPENSEQSLSQYLTSRDQLYQAIADHIIYTKHQNIAQLCATIHQLRISHGQ
jgi:shikimate kinase